MMKKIIAAILLGIMLCSLAAVSFADTNYFNFNISSASERPNGNKEDGPIKKNDSEQICYVTTTDGNVTAAKEFYVRSRTSVGNHEASQAMQITKNQYPYKLKYSVRKGIAGEYYNLRGQSDHPAWSKGRWNP